MKKFFIHIIQEWERTLLFCALGAVGLSGLFAYRIFYGGEVAQEGSPRGREAHRYFSNPAASYMAAPGVKDLKNPMSFTFRISLPEPPVKPRKDPEPKKETPAVQPKPEKTPEAPKTVPQPPAPPPRKIMVKYRGYLKGRDSGLAFYVATDSAGDRTESKFAGEGAMIHGIIEVKGFDQDKLTLAFGNSLVDVKRGKTQEFIIQ